MNSLKKYLNKEQDNLCSKATIVKNLNLCTKSKPSDRIGYTKRSLKQDEKKKSNFDASKNSTSYNHVASQAQMIAS